MSSETHDIGPAEVDTQKVALIGIGGALATFFLIVLMQFFFHFVSARIDLEKKGVAEAVKSAESKIAGQRERLVSDGRWINKDAGVAAVPIGVAMELAVAGVKPVAPPPVPTPAAPKAEPSKAAPKVDAPKAAAPVAGAGSDAKK